MQTDKIHSDVQSYYGETLSSSDDLKTSACCSIESMPNYIQPLLNNVHPEIRDTFYGCGSPIPQLLEGKTVLDLGSGTGRDSYLLAQLVGESGHVIGIDMTTEQIAIAQEHEHYHQNVFGYKNKNTTFIHGYIEDLASLGIKDNSIDIVISNCVINLSPAKQKVFAEIHRILKPGGEIYFSDIFADRRIPETLQKHKVMVGECLGGALYQEDFRRMFQSVGFADFRVISSGPVSLHNTELQETAGDIRFFSTTIRSFKCDFEDRCEDFGHSATYLGTIPEFSSEFRLDNHHLFPKDKAVAICGNTTKMLTESRFAPHFSIKGDFDTHRGLFDCTEESAPTSEGGCC